MSTPLGGARLATGWAARRAREVLDPLAVRRELGREGARAVPSRRLRARTGAPGARAFAEGGRIAAAELAALLGSSVTEVGSILDFGCGSGRVLPHISDLAPQARCTGCDVDGEAVRWAARNLPHLRWVVSGAAPPLPFESESFELIYSISVFSHLDEPMQDRWLEELQRVLRPNGIALLSVHGQHAFEQFRTNAVDTAWCPAGTFDRAPLSSWEFVFEPYIRSRWNQGALPGVGEAYGLAFHGERYLRAHWAAYFEIDDVRERALTDWQDVVVCRNRS